MDIIIYGIGANCEKVIKKIKEYNYFRLLGLADSYKNENQWGIPMIDVEMCVEEYKNVPVVISIVDPQLVLQVYYKLQSLGYMNIYRFLRKDYCWNSDFFQGSCVKLENIGKCWLPRLEMHAANHCNLNCKCCTHFSPLFDNTLPDYEQSMSDIKKLKRLIGGTLEFNLIGGEPLLNPNISDYIIGIRENLSITTIYIITNGLLIPKLNEDTLRCFHDNNVIVSVSEYKPTHRIIDKIRMKLEDFQVDYVIKSSKDIFYKPLTLSEHGTYMHDCLAPACVNVGNGKIARCPMILHLDKLNTRFGLKLTEEGVFDLDEFKDGFDLKNRMTKEYPLCRHCVKNEVLWGQCGGEIKVEDFVEL